MAGNLNNRPTSTLSPSDSRRRLILIATIATLAPSAQSPFNRSSQSIHTRRLSKPDPAILPTSSGDSIRSYRPSIRTVDTAEFRTGTLQLDTTDHFPSHTYTPTTSSCPRSTALAPVCRKSKPTATSTTNTSRLDPLRDFAIARSPRSTEGAGSVYWKFGEYAVVS